MASSSFRSGASLGNAQEMARHEGGRQRAYAVWAFLLAVGCGGLYIVFGVNPIPVFAIVVSLVIVVTLVMRPTFMLPLTLCGTCLFELQDSKFFDMRLTDYVPFFWNTNTIVQTYGGFQTFHYVPYSPFEMLLTLAFASWLVRSIADRSLKIRVGSLDRPNRRVLSRSCSSAC